VDQSFDGITNIVDVYVRHLRNKVDDPYEHKLIRTVRGVVTRSVMERNREYSFASLSHHGLVCGNCWRVLC